MQRIPDECSKAGSFPVGKSVVPPGPVSNKSFTFPSIRKIFHAIRQIFHGSGDTLAGHPTRSETHVPPPIISPWKIFMQKSHL